MRKALNDVVIQRLKPRATEFEITDAALPGFAVIVQPSGARSFALRYRIGGDRRKRKLTLGRYPIVSLADAREKARQALRLLSDGIDPADAIKAVADTAARNRFSDVVAEFIKKYSKPRNRTWAETKRLLTTGDLAGWQGRGVASISRRDVLDVLDAITGRGAPVQANRVFATLRRFFSWCVERGVVEGSPMTGLKPTAPEKSRDRMLTDSELVAVWRAAEAVGYPFGEAIKLLIITGQRRSEVLRATWSEIDVDARLWTIPRQRAKNDTEHVAPLSDAALAILEGLPRIGTHLFIGRTGETTFSGVSKATIRLNKLALAELRKGNPKATLPGWRLHDIRRAFASGCQKLGVPVHVTEKLLNHVSGSMSGIVGVYQRHNYLDERRRALDLWAAHVTALVSGKPKAANVVTLSRAKA